MEKFITSSAGITLGLMCREMFKYYYIKQIDHKIKTSINIDTSYEKLVKELDNREILIASSISKIKSETAETSSLIIKSHLIPKENAEKLFKVNGIK
jgi:hypothetical protein